MGRPQPKTRARREFLKTGMALAPAALAATLAGAQTLPGDEPPDRRMPDGRTQTEVILKADYDSNVRDARELTELAKSIELDFEKSDQNVLSLTLLKKLDDVEKITKRIRARVKR